MKWIVIVFLCAVAYAQDLLEEDQYAYEQRFRREADPQGSISVEAKKPLSGPDRRPSLDLNYNQRVYDRNGANANAYGGLNVRPGQPASPHLGVNFGKDYRNGQLGGFVQGERGRGGRITPSAGIQGSWRFRRDADEMLDMGEQTRLRVRRASKRNGAELEETGTSAQIVGKNRNGDPIASIDRNLRVFDDKGLKVNVFGGAKVQSGKTPNPEFGTQFRKDFDNGHVAGFARADKNPLGSFSPSYGLEGSYKTDEGYVTTLSGAEKRDPWGTSQRIGAGFGKEWENGRIGVGVSVGARRTPFSNWEKNFDVGGHYDF